MIKKTALIIGATGLIGETLLNLLIKEKRYHKVIVVSRRKSVIQSDKIEHIILEDFGSLDSVKDKLIASDVYCCIGTTIKKAGSKAQFRKIDLEVPYKLAEITSQNEVTQKFLIVTAMGSDASSRIYYNRVKGELEEKLKNLPIKSLKIFQPSLLLGNRKETRLMEYIAIMVVNFVGLFMTKRLKSKLGIKADDVAQAMINVASEDDTGVKVYTPIQIFDKSRATVQ